MKRAGCFFAVGALALMLTACGSDSSVNGTEQENITEENLIGVKPDIISEENLEYYYCKSGSSSLSQQFAVYKYNGEFVFIADYFNCGNELMETYLLPEKESGLFLEEVNAVSTREVEEAGDKEGAYTERAVLVVDGTSYQVESIEFEALGIHVTDAYEAEYPTEEESAKYEIEGILELQESAQWKERSVFIGGREFERSVGEQIEEWSGEEIDRMVIDSFGDEDFIIKIETKKGDCYAATVTYSGYVAKAEKE